MRVAVVVVVLLAGCSNAAPPATVECEEDCSVVVADDDPGAIRGVVVDDAIVPVADATIVLQKGKDVLADARSNAEGVFEFRGLSADGYFLIVSKEGFQTTQSYVEPRDGVVRVMLTRVDLPPQMAFTLQWDGLMGCSIRSPAAWGQMCSFLGGITGPPFDDDSVGRFYEEFTAVAVHPDHLQVEMVWDSTQAMGGALTMMLYDMPESRSYGTLIHMAEQTSPIIVPLDANTTKAHAIGAPAGGGGARGVLMQIWAGAENYVGITYQQDFQVFITSFYGRVPDDGWAFVTHGEP